MQNKSLTIVGIIALVLVIAGFGAFYVWDTNQQAKEIEQFQKQDKADNQRLMKRTETISKYLADVQKTVKKEIPGFVIYGDEYAVSRGNVSFESYLRNDINNELFYDLNLETHSSASLEKYNLEIAVDNRSAIGEDYNTILTRYGVKPLIIADDFVIPAGSERTELTFKTDDNKKVTYALQDKEKLGSTHISDISGVLNFSPGEKGILHYYFIRDNEGKETKVKAGTKVHAESMDYTTETIPILYFGANDFGSAEAYVKTQKAIIDRQDKCGGRYFVIARTDKDSELDKAMTKQFGDNYYRIDMKNVGEIDYEALAKSVYTKMDKLGYFDNIKKSVSEAEAKIKKYDQAG